MIVIGVDEAGRGALVGPVVAGAVVLADDFHLPGLTDSKQLNSKKRDALYTLITEQCLWAVGESNAVEIDTMNILQATLLAMKRAVENINVDHNKLLVDGIHCPPLARCQTIIKGDLSEPVISAASIIAKVNRDRQMIALNQLYPKYGFSQHKGYGTKTHIQALTQFGAINEQHRMSFTPVKNLCH